MVLMSETTRQVVLLELTVPWEDRTEEAYERKRAKYEELASVCRSKGWRTWCDPIEVGCRGFAGQSLCRALKRLGIRGLHTRKAIEKITDAAERASRWLWIKRGPPWTYLLPRHKPGPGWVTWARVYDVERPETPNDPRLKLESASPAPTCTSTKTDHSMDQPVVFSGGIYAVNSRLKSESVSPAPTCISMKTDHSMDRPVVFSGGVYATDSRLKLESASPAPTCMSVKTDHSMDRPVVFSGGKDAIDSRELLANLLKADHFRCLVCAKVLKEPVSIPCGHSYCKTCIQSYWTKPTQTGSYSCPQCRKRFRTRPALDPNSALAKVVQKLQQAGLSPALPAHCYAGPGDVACDFCTGRKLRAVKSCLTCPASYCETHVKQHYTVAALQRHTLEEVTGELEQSLCKLHHRALEVFCRTDQTFICFICLIEEHKNHDTGLAKSEDPAVVVG
ncbi:hypothetical protein NFI96_006464 [Prochilodus magdalenae]|nr:hypothetical protein NFI96_006464 [Prochilodus magdalenae]